MATLETRYLPGDRLRALASGAGLPTTAAGSSLFADISGFTPITEKLRQALGARRGAETLAAHLNRVYDALIAQVERFGGTIISFAGDAITCWFDGDDAPNRAAACAFALLDAMQTVEDIPLPDGETAQIGLKVSIATGTARRFAVGDPAIQRIDALAGATVARMASGEGEAERGEVVADAATVARLGAAVRAWRGDEGERFAVLERLSDSGGAARAAPPPPEIEDVFVRPWLLPAVAGHFEAGLGEYLTELRPAVALFIRFTGIDYDHDPDAETKLDRFIRLVQAVVARYEGNVLQLTIGDKGSYVYAAFGAPYAHEDDAARALNAALEIRAAGDLDPIQIGISRGMMRTGAYGGETRRTYGVLGDEVNLAARLMAKAAPGEILVSETLAAARLDAFTLEPLPPVQVKGKANPVGLFRLVGRREQSFEARFYTTPLIGRERELESIRAALQPIFEGQHAGVIYIYGEPGMGKSRLAFEVQQRLQAERSVTWLTGQADNLNRAPLSPFSYFLRPYFGQRRDLDTARNLAAFETAFERLLANVDEANRADLLLYRSYLAGGVGLVIPDSSYAAADERIRIDNGVAAIKAWARAESQRQPLVLHLEDAQWLDAVSIQAVQQLTYNMETVPVALLLTSRYNDDGTHYTIPNIYSVPVHTVDLNRLSDEGVRALAESVLGGAVSEALAGFVRQRAEGNPFFTEQLALDLKERGLLVEAESGWDIRPVAEAEVPSGVNAVLIARLDRLAAQVKAVVQTAAVLGREFDVRVLSRMLREGEQSYIQTAESEAIWSALDALRYLFRHALLRDAAYQMQVQERLKGLHHLAAETIERLYPDDTAQYDALLEHWQGAGVPDRIVAYTIPVCERLVGVAADYPRAERLLRQALETGERERRATLLRLLGDAAQLTGQYPEAISHYEACLAAADETPTERIRALDGLGRVHMNQSDYPKAAEWSAQALALARSEGYPLGEARALETLGDTAFLQADHPTALAHYEESLRLYRELDERTGIAAILNNLGKIATLKANNAQAQVYLEECLSLSQELGDRQRMGVVLNNLGNLALDQGDYPTTRRHYERSLSIRRDIGDRTGIGASLGNLAILAHRQGSADEAREYGEASLRERRAIGDRKGTANALGILASVAYNQNDYATAQYYYGEILETQRAINERWGMATSLLNLGELARVRGSYAEARAYVEEGRALCQELGQPLYVVNAESALAMISQEEGDYETARRIYDEVIRARRELNDRRGLGQSLTYNGILTEDMGDLDQAETLLNEAVNVQRELGDRLLPWTLTHLARVEHKQGKPEAQVFSRLREALAQTKASMAVKTAVLASIAQTMYLFGRYERAGELVGLVLTGSAARDERDSLTKLLDELRLKLDAAALDAALERGRAQTIDGMIPLLLAEIGDV